MIGVLKNLIKITINRSEIKIQKPGKQNQIISFVFKQCDHESSIQYIH